MRILPGAAGSLPCNRAVLIATGVICAVSALTETVSIATIDDAGTGRRSSRRRWGLRHKPPGMEESPSEFLIVCARNR